jgi:hypothetical protein
MNTNFKSLIISKNCIWKFINKAANNNNYAYAKENLRETIIYII